MDALIVNLGKPRNHGPKARHHLIERLLTHATVVAWLEAPKLTDDDRRVAELLESLRPLAELSAHATDDLFTQAFAASLGDASFEVAATSVQVGTHWHLEALQGEV